MRQPSGETKYMIPEQDFPMVEAMDQYGGSFVKALANCLRHADRENYARLETAFPEYFQQYRLMAKE